MALLSEAVPVAVWDVREKTWWHWSRPQRSEWLKAHGLPADAMYRCEFYLIDAPFARIFCYHLNEHGNRHMDDARHEAAKLPPRDVILSDLPPPALLGA